MATTDFLHGVEVVEIDDGIRPISTLKSSVIGLVGIAGKGAKDTPIMITNMREAVAAFGEWDDTDGFTIPAALDAIYDQGSATVVVINCNDVAVNKTALVAQPCALNLYTGIGKLSKKFVGPVAVLTTIKAIIKPTAVATGTFQMPAGATVTAIKSADAVTTYTLTTHYTVVAGLITRVNVGGSWAIGASLEVTYTVTSLSAVTDYILDATAGTITRVASGSKILPGATLSVDFSYVNATAVAQSDIIGGTDGTTGQYKGVWALLGAKAQLGLQPRILLAPGYTSSKPDTNTANAVVAEFLGIAERLKAIILADGPNTTDQAAVLYRGDWSNRRVYILDPAVRVVAPSGATITQPYSSRMAGVISNNDNVNGFWSSPSNKEIKGIVGLARAVEFALGDVNSRANYLNSLQVVTALRESGFRTWGNRTASIDPKWAFVSVVRTNDMISESILQAHLWAVDKNITKNFVEAVVEGVNAYLRYLKNIGAVLGGKAWADPSLNTPDVISQGQIFIDYEFTPPFPAERITFRAHLVNDYVSTIFD